MTIRRPHSNLRLLHSPVGRTLVEAVAMKTLQEDVGVLDEKVELDEADEMMLVGPQEVKKGKGKIMHRHHRAILIMRC